MREIVKNIKILSSGAIFKKVPDREFSSQKSKCVSNFWTDEDRRETSVDRLKEIEAEESIGDVISSLKRHLAALNRRKPSQMSSKCEQTDDKLWLRNQTMTSSCNALRSLQKSKYLCKKPISLNKVLRTPTDPSKTANIKTVSPTRPSTGCI
jgi:hypothetical protein